VKILFLDIDGVVNSFSTVERYEGFVGIDAKLAAIVQKIIKDTDCKVVLSSTWRVQEGTRNHVKEMLVEYLDVTPVTGLRGFRGAEVKTWLELHPEVTRHAIIDDDDDFFEGQPLFRTDLTTGITEEIALAVTEYLNSTDAELSSTTVQTSTTARSLRRSS
jgi:HAD domain in Swiss Army Knife RNA repair proteins